MQYITLYKRKRLSCNSIHQPQHLPAMNRKCLVCGMILLGRIDKKFCSDQCRNRYHNSLSIPEFRFIRQVHYKLRKNRRIMMEFTQSGQHRITDSILSYAGFDFDYMTSMTSSDGDFPCFFCYEQGYIRTPDGNVTLIRKNLADEL